MEDLIKDAVVRNIVKEGHYLFCSMPPGKPPVMLMRELTDKQIEYIVEWAEGYKSKEKNKKRYQKRKAAQPT